MALQLRRGLYANLAAAAATALAGEPLISTDTKELYVGTGSGTVYKIGDILYAAVAPAVVAGKVFINTVTNDIYRASDDGSAWVKCAGTIDIATATDLGGLGSSDTKIPSQLAVKTYVDNKVAAIKIPQEWPDSVIDYVSANPAVPATGDRYLVKPAGTGLFAGHDNEMAQYDGAAWQFTAPTTGTFISVDADTTCLYYFGGATWAKKTFELNTAGTGIDITAGVVSIADTIVAADGSGGLTFVGGVLAVGVLDGGTF